MNCPNCKNTLIVAKTRPMPGNIRKRTRKCKKCGFSGITIERFEDKERKKAIYRH